MQIKLNRQKVSRYFKYHERFARKMSKFSKPGRGVRLPPPRPPRPVHLCYLVKLGAGLLSEKKIQLLCFVLHFFHSINAHLGLD